tara:strand:+ start:264 stop:575 length:312 start_codon:yes stop_codon:yes gene_type:complete
MYSGSYTAEGAKGLLADGGTNRRDEAKKMVESMGGSLEAYYWCYGSTDFMCIVDVPSSEVMSKFALQIGASGMFSGNLTPLITVEEMDKITGASVEDFRYPGQ